MSTTMYDQSGYEYQKYAQLMAAAVDPEEMYVPRLDEIETFTLQEPTPTASRVKKTRPETFRGCPNSKRIRSIYSASQIRAFEAEFTLNRYISRVRRCELAREADVSERQIKLWFQNRRMALKRSNNKDNNNNNDSSSSTSSSKHTLLYDAIYKNSTSDRSETSSIYSQSTVHGNSNNWVHQECPNERTAHSNNEYCNWNNLENDLGNSINSTFENHFDYNLQNNFENCWGMKFDNSFGNNCTTSSYNNNVGNNLDSYKQEAAPPMLNSNSHPANQNFNTFNGPYVAPLPSTENEGFSSSDDPFLDFYHDLYSPFNLM